MFIKTRTKHASKDGSELAVFVAFGVVLSFGFGVAELFLVCLLAVLLVNGALLRSHRCLRHTQTSTQSRQRNKSFIAELIIKIWSSE